MDARIDARIEEMSDEVLEQQLRLSATATERKRQLIENAKEKLKVLRRFEGRGRDGVLVWCSVG